MSLVNTMDLNRFETAPELASQSSYSAMKLHRKCPQAFTYRYILGLEEESDEPTPYKTLGTWWAVLRAVESLTRGREGETLVFVPESLSDAGEGFDFNPKTAEVAEVFEGSERRWKSMSADERDAFTQALGDTLPERLRSMYDMWNAANRNRFEREAPLGAEVYWERELPRPESDARWSLVNAKKVPTMKLIGYVDEVYFDRERGMVVVRDHKSMKDLSRGNSALDDLMDSQLMLYAWGITPLFKEKGLQPPRAVGYDRVRSVAPKEPVLTASGGLSKSVTAYDLDTYKRWAMKDTRPTDEELWEMVPDGSEADRLADFDQLAEQRDKLKPGRMWGKFGEYYVSGAKKGQPKFGIYELDPKVLENLSTPAEKARWVARTLTPVNRHMLEAHLRTAVDSALDIFETSKRVQETGAAARNLDRVGCSWCEFAPLCQAQLVGGPRGEYELEAYGLRQREKK